MKKINQLSQKDFAKRVVRRWVPASSVASVKNEMFFQKCLMMSLSFLFCVSFLEAQEDNAPRVMAPGVVKTIRPTVNFSETFQWSDIPALVGLEGENDWAKDLFFNKEIWCLEFSFKPVRMMTVDFPTEAGTMEKKNVWYLVYSVTNTGKFMGNEIELPSDDTVNVLVHHDGQYEPQPYLQRNNNLEGTYKPKLIDYTNAAPDAEGKQPGTVRFNPQFILASGTIEERISYESEDGGLREFFVGQGNAAKEGVYEEAFLPLALMKIAAFEDPQLQFKNSIELPVLDIKPGETVWGIATWIDVDSRIDTFSVYISGLSNSLSWKDASEDDMPEAYDYEARPLTGRDIKRRVLKLNFYRPGDEFDENSQEFYYGTPGDLDYQWIYL